MTLPDLVTTCRGAGIELTPSGDRLRVVAPKGTLTANLRATLANRKIELLAVLVRLDGMRQTVGEVPIPCALADAVGGPGRCFSCGDSLPEATSCGRCVACDLAAELFYRECPDAADRWSATRNDER